MAVLSRLPHPSAEMTQSELNNLYGLVTSIARRRLEEGDFSAYGSLIALAHEIMAETSWRRFDVDVAVLQAIEDLGLTRRYDSLEMSIRPSA